MKTEKYPRKLTPVGAIMLVNTVDGKAFTAAESIIKTGWNGIRNVDVVLGPISDYFSITHYSSNITSSFLVQSFHT